MKRRTPPSHLTEAFRRVALTTYLHGRDGALESVLRLHDGGPACWLAQFDPLERPCSGDLEAIHLLGRQRIRNVLQPLLAQARLGEPTDGIPLLLLPLAFFSEEVDDLVELAEWDPRNAALGCTGHHRRYDNHATPALPVPAAAVPVRFLAFTYSWGFEAEGCRKFGEVLPLLPEPGASAGPQQQQPPLVGAGAGAPLAASAGSGESPTAIAGSGAEDMEGVGVAPAPTGPSAASGDRPNQHQRRSDQ